MIVCVTCGRKSCGKEAGHEGLFAVAEVRQGDFVAGGAAGRVAGAGDGHFLRDEDVPLAARPRDAAPQHGRRLPRGRHHPRVAGHADVARAAEAVGGEELWQDKGR